MLNRIALSALPTSLETVVADSFELILLGSTRQFVLSDNRILAYSGKKSLVVGGINYDNESTEMFACRASTKNEQGTISKLWGSLPWAEKESKDLVALMKAGGFAVGFMSGTNAREKAVVDSLESKTGWRVLHFATHGFFTSKTKTESDAPKAFMAME